jgi:hypothetical protein
MTARRDDEFASCAGKRSYATPAAAHEAVRIVERKRGKGLYVYRCRICGAWHYGARVFHQTRPAPRFKNWTWRKESGE